jgi:hypothetical protein
VHDASDPLRYNRAAAGVSDAAGAGWKSYFFHWGETDPWAGYPSSIYEYSNSVQKQRQEFT